MAKMLAYYSLCPINDVAEFLGLSRDVNAGCAINTLGRNIVQVVKLSNQKLQHSWTSLERLSSKVVYDFRSQRYVGVFGGRYVRCWPADQADINKVKKVKFYRTIAQLYAVATGQVLVLYDDGSCESLESAVDTRNEDRKAPEQIERGVPVVDVARESIVDVCTVVLDSGRLVLGYFVRDGESGTMTLNYCLLAEESLKPLGFRKVKLERAEQKVHLVGQSLVEGGGSVSLITIWSDKRIFTKTLPFDSDGSSGDDRSIGNFISILNMINTSQPLSMVGISRDYIAIYANNLNQDGGSLLLYNVQFKVVQAKQFFKVFFGNSRFWLVENHLLLAFGQTLAVVPYKISKEQLSDMVGTQRGAEVRNYVDNESINEDCDFNEGYGFVGDLEEVSEGEESEGEDEGPEVVYKLFESVGRFEETLQEAYKSDLMVETVRDEGLPEDVISMRLMSNVDGSVGPLLFSESFELLASELEKHGFCEMEITEKIIPLMIQAGASMDIGKCLKRYSTVSERSLVSALKYALGCKEKKTPPKATIPDVEQLLEKVSGSKLPKVSEEQPNLFILEDQSPQPIVDLLNIILSCSVHRTLILPLLRKEIDLSSVLALLDHLLFLLTDPVATLTETPANADTFDSDEQVIAWATLLIDSHYQQIVLSRDAEVKRRLLVWAAVVKRHAEALDELKSLAPTIQRLVAGKHNQGGSQQNRWYSVETVQLY
uniref:Nucleolar protein 11-like n=2 Tax=Culex pipiens TaxID=7175 RepID=A0A8D8CQY3_CULPI